MSVGEAIRYYRKAKGLTQAQLATRAGFKAQGSITYYERDRHDPRLSCLVALAEALEVPVCWLLTSDPGGCPPSKTQFQSLAGRSPRPADSSATEGGHPSGHPPVC